MIAYLNSHSWLTTKTFDLESGSAIPDHIFKKTTWFYSSTQFLHGAFANQKRVSGITSSTINHFHHINLWESELFKVVPKETCSLHVDTLGPIACGAAVDRLMKSMIGDSWGLPELQTHGSEDNAKVFLWVVRHLPKQKKSKTVNIISEEKEVMLNILRPVSWNHLNPWDLSSSILHHETSPCNLSETEVSHILALHQGCLSTHLQSLRKVKKVLLVAKG